MMKPRKTSRYTPKVLGANIKLQQLQQQQFLQQQAAAKGGVPPPPQPGAVPPGAAGGPATIHDEAEVMNFRHLTAARFVQNQELLEAVAEKNIPLKNIVAPPAFPEAGLYVAENPLSVWAGNLGRVKELANANAREIEELERENQTLRDSTVVLGRPYAERKRLLARLKLAFRGAKSLEEIDSALVSVKTDYENATGNKKAIRTTTYVQKSLSALRPPDFAEAPPGWYEKQQQLKLELQKKKEEELRRKQQEEEEALRRKAQEEKEKAELEKLRQEQLQQQQQATMPQLGGVPHLGAPAAVPAQVPLAPGSVLPQAPALESQPQPLMAGMPGADPMGFNYDANMNGDLNLGSGDVFSGDIPGFMDDDGFGIHSALEDNDFLSQIDHSME